MAATEPAAVRRGSVVPAQLGGGANRSSVWPIAALAVGTGAIVVASSGHATGTDPPVLALAAWLVGPLAAGVLGEFRPGHRLGRILVGLGAVPATALALETIATRQQPSPDQLVSSPLLLVVAAMALTGVAYAYRDTPYVAAAAVAGAAATAAAAAMTAGGTAATAGYVTCALAAAVPAISTLVILTAPPWMHLGVVRTVILAGVVLVLVVAVVITVVVVGASIEVPGPTGTAPAFAVLLGLGLVPLVSWVYQALGVRLYGTSRQPGLALVNLYDRVPDAGDPSALVAAAAAAVASAVRSPGARVLPDNHLPHDGVGSAPAVVPLVAGGEHVGSLVVDPRRPGESFTRRDLTRLAQLTPAVAAIVQTARLAQALEDAHRDLASLRETERRRLHHDLHDGMGPLLAGLAMQVASLRRAAEGIEDPEGSVQRRIAEAADAVAQCQAETRRLVEGLAPERLDRMNLQEALTDLATGWSSALAGTGMRVDVSFPSDLVPLPTVVRVAAYRIAAEAVTNVVRHAGARWCRIEADTSSGGLFLRILDDGVGHDGHRPGVGLRSMQERAKAAGGNLQLTALDSSVASGQRGRGTVVEVTFESSEGP